LVREKARLCDPAAPSLVLTSYRPWSP
jgi:hypothetical protein